MIFVVIACFVNIFFTIFNSNLAKFDDLSPLFLDHPYMILDHSMFGNNNDIDSPSWKDETPSNKMVEEVDKLNNEFPENTKTIDAMIKT